MTYPCSRPDRERTKFFDNGLEEPTVRVGGTGSVIEGIIYDAMTGEETSATVETYRYYMNGTTGTLLATVIVTYSDATKCFVNSVVRTPVVP